MRLFERIGSRHRTAPPVVVEPGPPPVPVSPVDALVAAHDWDAVAALGSGGRDALVAELRRLADLDPLPRRIAGVGEPDPHATYPLIGVLVGLDDPTVPPVLVELLARFDDNADPLRGMLLEGLGRTGNELAATALVDRALHDSATCTWSGNVAADVLVAHPCVGTVPMLLTRLGDPDPEVRTRAVALLGRLGDASTVPQLVALLDDPEATIRTAAARALGASRDERAVIPLLVADERDRRTRRGGHGSAAYDGLVSPTLVAVDDIVGGDDAETARWQVREDPLAVESGILDRTSEIRARYAAEVEARLGDVPEVEPQAPTVEQLLGLLAGPDCDREPPSGLRFRGRPQLDRALRRCAGLGCSVGEESRSESSPDPQGGEDWWVTVPVTCADGPAQLTVRESYTPMY